MSGTNDGFTNWLEYLQRQGKLNFWGRSPAYACELCDYESPTLGKCPECGSKIKMKLTLLHHSMDNLIVGWRLYVGKSSGANSELRRFLSEIGVKKTEYGWAVIR